MGGREYASVSLLNKVLNVVHPLGDSNRGYIKDIKPAQEIDWSGFYMGDECIAVIYCIHCLERE